MALGPEQIHLGNINQASPTGRTSEMALDEADHRLLLLVFRHSLLVIDTHNGINYSNPFSPFSRWRSTPTQVEVFEADQ